MAGIVAIYNQSTEPKSGNVIYDLADAMRMLQHRGKAYWKMMAGAGSAGREGWLPDSKTILHIATKEKLKGQALLPALYFVWSAINTPQPKRSVSAQTLPARS